MYMGFALATRYCANGEKNSTWLDILSNISHSILEVCEKAVRVA